MAGCEPADIKNSRNDEFEVFFCSLAQRHQMANYFCVDKSSWCTFLALIKNLSRLMRFEKAKKKKKWKRNDKAMRISRLMISWFITSTEAQNQFQLRSVLKQKQEDGESTISFPSCIACNSPRKRVYFDNIRKKKKRSKRMQTRRRRWSTKERNLDEGNKQTSGDNNNNRHKRRSKSATKKISMRQRTNTHRNIFIV